MSVFDPLCPTCTAEQNKHNHPLNDAAVSQHGVPPQGYQHAPLRVNSMNPAQVPQGYIPNLTVSSADGRLSAFQQPNGDINVHLAPQVPDPEPEWVHHIKIAAAVEPGDTLFIVVSPDLDPEAAGVMAQSLNESFPNNKVLVSTNVKAVARIKSKKGDTT